VSGFEENLLVEAIGLVVGLLATYFIVEWLLRLQDRRQWQPVHDWLRREVKSTCEIAMLVWAWNAKPDVTADVGVLSGANFRPVIDALRHELEELETSLPVPNAERPDAYWLGVARGLGSSDEALGRAVMRAGLGFRDNPHLATDLLELESVHRGIAAFRADEDMFGAGKVSVALPMAVLKALRLHVNILDSLNDSPGATS
jgi:hypothetical protein